MGRGSGPQGALLRCARQRRWLARLRSRGLRVGPKVGDRRGSDCARALARRHRRSRSRGKNPCFWCTSALDLPAATPPRMARTSVGAGHRGDQSMHGLSAPNALLATCSGLILAGTVQGVAQTIGGPGRTSMLGRIKGGRGGFLRAATLPLPACRISGARCNSTTSSARTRRHRRRAEQPAARPGRPAAAANVRPNAHLSAAWQSCLSRTTIAD
jgi:hypothetical protein